MIMNGPRLGLIDYGSGNLRSVGKALEKIGAHVVSHSGPAELEGMDGLVLPGVGAFGDCVRQLRERALWDPIADWLRAGRPFLGICLGYQLLFESSEESPGVAGFAKFPGKVRRFRTPGLKVPQIGWNSLQLTRPDARLWRGIANDEFVYFVHSYFPSTDDPALVAATTEYGEVFSAAIERDWTMGVQFHPEKSQDAGLAMLANFASAVTAYLKTAETVPA